MTTMTYNDRAKVAILGEADRRLILTTRNVTRDGVRAYWHTLSCGHEVGLREAVDSWSTRIACPTCMDMKAVREG
jgi:hypothetical protein